MKEKWKHIFLAILCSGIIVGIYVGNGILYITTEIEKLEDQMGGQNIGNMNILSDPLSDPSIQIILIYHAFWAIVGFVVLTLIFYFAINYLKKRKK